MEWSPNIPPLFYPLSFFLLKLLFLGISSTTRPAFLHCVHTFLKLAYYSGESSSFFPPTNTWQGFRPWGKTLLRGFFSVFSRQIVRFMIGCIYIQTPKVCGYALTFLPVDHSLSDPPPVRRRDPPFFAQMAHVAANHAKLIFPTSRSPPSNFFFSPLFWEEVSLPFPFFFEE